MQIKLGAQLDLTTTGTSNVESQIARLEKDFIDMGKNGDQAGQRWVRQLIEVAKLGKEIVGTLERIGKTDIGIDPSSLAVFQTGIQSAVESGITNGMKAALTNAKAAQIAAQASQTQTQAQNAVKSPNDLTASITKLEATISSFALVLQKQSAAAGPGLRERIQAVTGRPQFNDYQEIGEISTREQGKEIRRAAQEIVVLLGDAERTLQEKKADVRNLVKALKEKIDVTALTSGLQLSMADQGKTLGSLGADIINEDLFSAISSKFNIEMLSDVDQMFKLFDQGFEKLKAQGGKGMSLLRDEQGKWLTETSSGQRLIAALASQFFASQTPYPMQSQAVRDTTYKAGQGGVGDFNLQTDFMDQLGTGDDAENLKKVATMIQAILKTYEEVENVKTSIVQLDAKNGEVSSTNMQKLERMLAINRDQLALAKENNAVSVRYNTILQQNQDMMGRSFDAINLALISDDMGEIAILQREYSNQIQKSSNLEKNLQQLIERNKNLQQGFMGQLNNSLAQATAGYFKMGTTINDVTKAIVAQDKARKDSGGTPQFEGFTSGLKTSSSDIGKLLAGNGINMAEKMFSGNFTGIMAAVLKEQIKKAMQKATTDPELAVKLASGLDDLASRLFEFASATQGAEGIDNEMTASLLQMAEGFHKNARAAAESAANVKLYGQGLDEANKRQEAVRASAASVELVLKQLRSQLRVGDEAGRIIERVQRNAERSITSIEQVIAQSADVVASLQQPLGLFDRNNITNAKAYLESIKAATNASKENVASLEQAKRMAVRDVEKQGVAAEKGLPSTFEGVNPENLKKAIAEAKAATEQYYDNLITKATESSTAIGKKYNETFRQIDQAVRTGTAFNNIQDGLGRVGLKVSSLAEQYRQLNSATSKNSDEIMENAADMKQAVQDSASLSREIRQLKAEYKTLADMLDKTNSDPLNMTVVSQEEVAQASLRIRQVKEDLEKLEAQQKKNNEVRFGQNYISSQQISSTLGKNRETGDRLIGQINPSEIQAQMRKIFSDVRSTNVDDVARAATEFKSLKSVLTSTANEADKVLRSYDALTSRSVQLSDADKSYIQILRQVKSETSSLMVEMTKQEGTMKAAETRVKANTQSFADYSQQVYMGVKSQVDFAIGAGAMTGAVAAIGMGFRELITESKMLSRTLTVLQSDILNTEEVSKIAYERARQLSVQYGMTIGQVSDVAKELGSAGMKLGEVNRAWEDTLRAINATNSETTQVTRAVAGIYNVYRQELKETGNEMNEVGIITDTLTSIFQNHQAEMDEIVQGYKFVVGTGKAAGFTFQEMGSYLAVLNDNMIKSGMAGRGLQVVFAQTAAKTDQLAKMFNIKLDPSKTIASQFNDLLQQMNEKIGGVEVSARDMNKIFQIFDKQGARAFVTLVQQYPAVRKALHETENAAAGVTGEMNRIINQSLDRRFYQMKQAILDVARNGFDELKPVMIQFLDMIKGAAKLFANFNSATGGVIVKVSAYTVAMAAALTVSRTTLALLNGAIGTKLIGGLSGIQTAFMNSSAAGKNFIEVQSKVKALQERRAILNNTPQFVNGPTAGTFVRNPALDTAKTQIQMIDTEINTLNKTTSRLDAIFKSAFALAAPMLFLGALLQIGSMIDHVQNRSQRLTEELDISKGALARINNELFRLNEANRAVTKLSDAFARGFMGADQMGRAVRDIIEGLGKDAQMEFLDISGMSNEDIAANFETGKKIKARLAEFEISQIKKVEEARIKEQQVSFKKQADILKQSYVKITDMNDRNSGANQMRLDIYKDIIEAEKQIDAFNPMGILTGGKGILKAAGAQIMSSGAELLGKNTVSAFSGQDPKKIQDQYEAIAAVLDANKKRESDINKLREQGLILVQEEAKYGNRGKLTWASRQARGEIEELQKKIGGDLVTPEQKRLFEEMIGNFQKWRSQSRMAGESTAFFEGQLNKFLKDDMKLPTDQIDKFIKRLKETDYDSILIPNVSVRNEFEALTGEVNRLRSSFNWTGSTAEFDRISESAIVARQVIDDLAVAKEAVMRQNMNLEMREEDTAALASMSPAVASRIEEFKNSGVLNMQFKTANSLNQQIAEDLADSVSLEALKERLKEAGLENIEIPIGFDPKLNDENNKKLKEDLVDRIKGNLEEIVFGANKDLKNIKDNKLSIETVVPVNIRALSGAVKNVIKSSSSPENVIAASGQLAQVSAESDRSANLGIVQSKLNDLFIKGGKGLEEQAFRVAEINSLLKKQNELAGIINKKNQDIRTTVEKLVFLNKGGTLKLSEDLNKSLKNTLTNDKDRLKTLIEINKELKKQVDSMALNEEGSAEMSDEQKKILEAKQASDKALIDYAANRAAEIAKNREIAIQLEQEKNTLVEKTQLLGQTLMYYTEGYSFAVKSLQIEEMRVNAKFRELMVSRQILGIKNDEKKAIRSIADLYELIERRGTGIFKSGKESVAGFNQMIDMQIGLIRQQRKVVDEFANENKLLIETIGATQSIIMNDEDSMYGKASKQIFDMLARLPEINAIEEKIQNVKMKTADLSYDQISSTDQIVFNNNEQLQQESQLIQLYSKKVKLLSDMVKANNDLKKSLKEQLVDDKRPELYQAASDALRQFQQPLEKETGDRLKNLFDKNEMATALGIQQTTGDPLMFILQNREEAMKRFMIAAKDGRVEFDSLSSSIQNTLEPQLKAYQQMLGYESKLKSAFVSRADKAGGNLSDAIGRGDFSRSNSNFATLQQSILEMTRKTGNEMLTVEASEKLVKINELMLEAEKYQQEATIQQMKRLNFNIETMSGLFVEEAKKIQAVLLQSFGGDWDNVQAALDGTLDVRSIETEKAFNNVVTKLAQEVNQLNYVLALFAKSQGIAIRPILGTENQSGADQVSSPEREARRLANEAKIKQKAEEAIAAANARKKAMGISDDDEKKFSEGRKKIADEIRILSEDLVNWAKTVKDTAIDSERYAESLKIIQADSKRAAEVIQEVGKKQREVYADSSNFWTSFGQRMLEGLFPAYSGINDALFSLTSIVGNIDYAVENAQTYKELLESIRQATQTYIGSVNDATTALKRNESSYYDYINSIQDAEKQRYEDLIAAEKEYRENLKKTEDVFKTNFLKPISDAFGGKLTEGIASIRESSAALFESGLNSIGFGLGGLNADMGPSKDPIEAQDKNTVATIENTKALREKANEQSEAVKEYLANSATAQAWKVHSAAGGMLAGATGGAVGTTNVPNVDADGNPVRSDAGRGDGSFIASLTKGLAQVNLSMVSALIGGAVSAFGSVVGMAFDATISNQTDYLLKFVEKFATELPTMIQNFATKFTEFLPQLVGTLVTQVVPSVMSALVEVLPNLLTVVAETFANNLGPFVTSIVQGIKDLAGPLFKSLIGAVKNILPALMEIIPALSELLPYLLTEAIGSIIKNLPGIFLAAVMTIVSLLAMPIEMIMGAIRAIASFFGADISGFSIMKYIAKATKAMMDFVPTFHKGGVVPGAGESAAVLLGGEGVINRRGMQTLGAEGLAALNKGYAPMVKSYEALGAAQISKMGQPSRLGNQGLYGANGGVTNDIGGISIVINGNAPAEIERLPKQIVDKIDRELAKKRANRDSKQP